MNDPNEAVRILRNITSQNHFTMAQMIEYNRCKNIIEDALINHDYILVKEGENTAKHNDRQS